MNSTISPPEYLLPTAAKVFTTSVHILLGTLSIPINEIMIRYSIAHFRFSGEKWKILEEKDTIKTGNIGK